VLRPLKAGVGASASGIASSGVRDIEPDPEVGPVNELLEQSSSTRLFFRKRRGTNEMTKRGTVSCGVTVICISMPQRRRHKLNLMMTPAQ
jgi:hypothetical protein